MLYDFYAGPGLRTSKQVVQPIDLYRYIILVSNYHIST